MKEAEPLADGDPMSPVACPAGSWVDTTVNGRPLLLTPATRTMTLPVVAPAGTVVAMLVADHVFTLAVMPLNITVLVPCENPKFEPVSVTAAPTGPLETDRLASDGGGGIVNATPLLGPPAVDTTTLPVAAPAGTVTPIEVGDQLVTEAQTPLNVTVPFAAPNPVPVMVTAVPIGPLEGDSDTIVGTATPGTSKITSVEYELTAPDVL